MDSDYSNKRDLERVIQEYVPGKQVNLAHTIANPAADLCQKVGVDHSEAIGILNMTPGESAIIAGDVAIKAANVELGFLDRFSGAIVLTGSIGAVDASLESVLSALDQVLGFNVCKRTRS